MRAPLAKVAQGLRARRAGHGAVNDARGHAQRVQGVRQMPRVIDRHAEGDRAPVARQLLDRPRDQGVALLDVDRFGQLLLVVVEAPARKLAQVGGGGDAVATQRSQEAVLDQLGQRARVDDLLEDVVEPLAVAARRRRREAEQRAREGGVEHAELPQDAQVVLGRRVVALVIDDEPHVAAPQDARQPLLVQRANRAHEHLRLSRRPERAALDLDDGVALERADQLLPRLRQQLLAMSEHQHLASGQPGQVREDHRLAGARRQMDQQATPARPARREHGVDRGSLVGTQIAERVGRQRGSHTPTSAAPAKDCLSFR